HALRQRLAVHQGLWTLRWRLPDEPLRGLGPAADLRRGPPADPDSSGPGPSGRAVLLLDRLRKSDGDRPPPVVCALRDEFHAVYLLRRPRQPPPARPAECLRRDRRRV